MLQKYKSIEEFKGTQECKIRHFAFCYNNGYPIHKKAKYNISYWLQELSLDQFKGILEDKKDLYNLGINLNNIDMFSNIKAVENLYFVKRTRRTLQVALKKVKIKNLFETLEDKEVNIKIVIDDSVVGVKTILNIMIIALQDGRESD